MIGPDNTEPSRSRDYQPGPLNSQGVSCVRVAGFLDPLPCLWLARVGLLLGLCGSSYLLAISLSGGAIPGCGSGSGCDRVISSRWAYWLSLPVSFPACAMYLTILACSVAVTQREAPKLQQRAGQLILVLCPVVLAAALWFFFLQLFVLKTWCKYCLATHVTAGVGAALLLGVLAANRKVFDSFPSSVLGGRRLLLSSWSAMAGLGILIAGQVAVKTRHYALTSLFASHQLPGRLNLHHGKFNLNSHELPCLGNASATNLMVSVFDYTCSHCRALHPLLAAAADKYVSSLGIISLPAPLDAQCNPLIVLTAPANQNACEYAKLALAIWHGRPAAFKEFDDWMFASAQPPTLNEARAKAETILGKEALEAALSDGWVARQIQTDIALYQANGRAIGDARLPQLVIGDVIMHGAIDRLEDLVSLLEQHVFYSPSGDLKNR